MCGLMLAVLGCSYGIGVRCVGSNDLTSDWRESAVKPTRFRRAPARRCIAWTSIMNTSIDLWRLSGDWRRWPPPRRSRTCCSRWPR